MLNINVIIFLKGYFSEKGIKEERKKKPIQIQILTDNAIDKEIKANKDTEQKTQHKKLTTNIPNPTKHQVISSVTDGKQILLLIRHPSSCLSYYKPGK